MATTKRDNSQARWAVLLASWMAVAGFFGVIINGPQPAQAGPGQAVTTQTVTQTGQPAGTVLNGSPRQRVSAPSIAQAPQFSTAPRLRTRGS